MPNRTFSFLFISALVLILFLPCLSSADPLDTWHWRNPLPQGNALGGITFGNGTFVAVGNSGTILQSGPTRATPAVRVNNASEQITLRSNEALSVTVSFDAGGMSGINADWWVVAYAPYGWSYYVHPGMWFYAPSPESFRPAAQGPLFSFSPIEVLNITGLHAGTYVVYFGVDTNANGVVDYDQLILDSTTIDIVP